MGVDFSHGDAHFSHGGFNRFRTELAAVVGIRLDQMRGFGRHILRGGRPWAEISDPLAPLLSRNDAGEEISADECRSVAVRLRQLFSHWASGAALAIWADEIEMLLAGLDAAAAEGVSFDIMG
jgi:hypothetical protein